MLWLRWKLHSELPGLCEVEKGEGRACKASFRPWPKEHRHSPPYRSERTADRLLCRADGPRRGVESRRSRGRVVKATTPPTPIPNPPSQPLTEAFQKPKGTTTRKTARPQKSELITTAAPKLAVGKSKKKTVASVKIAATEPTTPTWWSQNDVPPPHSRKCLISSITVPYMHVWR